MNNFALVDLGIDIYHGDEWIIWCPAENLEAARALYPESEGFRYGDRRRATRNVQPQQEQQK